MTTIGTCDLCGSVRVPVEPRVVAWRVPVAGPFGNMALASSLSVTPSPPSPRLTRRVPTVTANPRTRTARCAAVLASPRLTRQRTCERGSSLLRLRGMRAWEGKDHRYGRDPEAFVGERLLTDYALREAWRTALAASTTEDGS